jgi:KDO2-lipid IV(A) lauroyltransferase
VRKLLVTARDARLGERWSPLQRAKNDALWIAAWTALAVARVLPAPALRALGRLLGRAAHGLARSARRTAEVNVARVFPDRAEAARRDLVRRCFARLGELLGDAVSMLRRAPGAPLDVTAEARAVLDAAIAEGRGVVFASAHLGPWERVAASLVAAGYPLVALARESYDPRFSELYRRIRAGQGVRVIWRAAPGAAARILRTLRGGGMLGVPMDLRSRVPSCDAPFLGHSAPTPVGPARIALRSGAPVVVGTAAPGPKGAVVVTATRIPCADLVGPGGSAPASAAAAVELTARINAELSRRILAMPDAWVWMHDRWPGTIGRMMASEAPVARSARTHAEAGSRSG